MIIDSDGHVIEDLREIHDFLEAPYRNGLALQHGLERGHSYWPELDGFSRPAMANRLTLETDSWTSAQLWLEVLDQAELEQTVLYPTLALAYGRIRDVDWAAHLARPYNLWLEERYYRVDNRLGWVALLPLQEPAEAAAELRRSVTEDGALGAVLTPSGLNQALGGLLPHLRGGRTARVPLIVHGAPAVVLPDIFDRFSHVHVLAHPVVQFMSMTSMFKAGVFGRFTTLRLGFFEAGASWVPFLVNRLDRTTSILCNEPYGAYASEDGPRLPSSVIQEGRVFFSVEGDEPLVPYVHEQGSAKSVAKEASEISERDDLSDEQKQSVLHDNALSLYRSMK